MTAKPARSINWIEVAKFVGAVVIGLSGGVGFTEVNATTQTSQSRDSSEDCRAKLNLHTATDSVRWVYTERRLERIETMTAESHDILRRIESSLSK